MAGEAFREEPVVFHVDGSPLVGVFHGCEKPADQALLMIAAGGPQYRAGVGRQLVGWARRFAALGMPVLRFDYRGMGDSGGPFRGFQHVEDDIRAAIDVLCDRSGVGTVILFGGCNAASAILMYLGRDERVARFIVTNPMLDLDRVPKAGAAVLGDFAAVKVLARRWLGGGERPADQGDDYTAEMLEGAEHYTGKGLFMISTGVVAEEFLTATRISPRWRALIEREENTLVALEGEGHTIAGRSGRGRVFDVAARWLELHG